MNPQWLELLYRSFDESLDEGQLARLENALSSSPELRAEKKRIEATRNLMSSHAARSFKPFFVARVMQRIQAETAGQDDFFESLIWIFRRLALVGALTVVILFASALWFGKASSVATLFGMPQVTIEDTLQLDTPLEE
jgi:hypothetical protein